MEVDELTREESQREQRGRDRVLRHKGRTMEEKPVRETETQVENVSGVANRVEFC